MKRFLLLSILLMTLALPVAAQDDPTALVLDAFARLEEGYRFTYESDVSQTFTADESSSQSTIYHYEASGEVDASGSYIGQSTVVGTGTTGGHTEESAFDFERAQVDGVDYVSLGERRDAVPQFADVEPGWHRTDDLKSELDDYFAAFVLDSLTQLNLPTSLPLKAELITGVAELEPAGIDGIPVRVFDVAIDAVQSYREAALESGMLTLENLTDLAVLLDAGDFDTSLTVWIGADDGLLYRVEGEYEMFMPYASAGVEGTGLPPYDHAEHGTYRFDFTDHAAVDPIAPPIP